LSHPHPEDAHLHTSENKPMDVDTRNELIKFLEENKKDKEPALRPAVVTGFVAMIATALTAFGFNVDEEKVNALAVILMLAVPIVAALWTRRKAWSSETVNKLMESMQAEWERIYRRPLR
jgi:uncharacterized membrane protein YqjE